MPRRIELKWFRLWAPEVLGADDPDGFNASKQLGPQEHFCWIALRALCAMTEFQPLVCQSPYNGYTDNQFAQAFKVHHQTWMSCKQKLEFAGKIVVDAQNVIRIVGWERFGGRYFQGRVNRDGELKVWTAEEEERREKIRRERIDMFKRIIAHLNKASGKDFRVNSTESFKHFNARCDEGATEQLFRHVVDVKCAQWLGRQDMECYLRPSTLFNSAKFWEYVAEPTIKRKLQVGVVGPRAILPEEQVKWEEEAKKEYNDRLRQVMAERGWTSDQDIDYMKVPTFIEFFATKFLPRKREEERRQRNGENDDHGQ